MILDHIKSTVGFAHNLPRYGEIVGTLWKYGFADVLKLMALQRVLGMEDVTLKLHEEGVLSKPLPERMRLALEELGPTFVKLGQILSSRRDLLPDEYYLELCKLQATVPPFPVKESKAIITEELGKPISKLFARFENTPLGSASIAQVHEAELHDGTKVAVKVQRPDIVQIIERDLAILLDLARFVERHSPDLATLNPVGVVTEFSLTLLKELDFTHEAKNAQRFADQFAEEPMIKVPAIYPELSSVRVLTMEFISGLSVDDERGLKKAEIDPEQLAEQISRLIYDQIFKFGFFHGDPHPGNLYILPEGVIGLMDYGMMGYFSPHFRSSVAQLVAGLAEKNHQQVMTSILEMSEEGYVMNSAKMLTDVENFSEAHLAGPLGEIRLGEVLNKLLEMLRRNQLRMKGSFYLGIKALTQVEAIGRSLNPNLNFILLGEPYARAQIEKNYHPDRLLILARKLFGESLAFLDEFPHDFRNFYQQVKRGKVNIPVKHKLDPDGFEPMRKTLDSIANRLTNAILAASVLVGSTILIHSGLPPKLWGVPIIGLAGLVCGGYMCLRLFLSTWRHGGL